MGGGGPRQVHVPASHSLPRPPACAGEEQHRRVRRGPQPHHHQRAERGCVRQSATVAHRHPPPSPTHYRRHVGGVAPGVAHVGGPVCGGDPRVRALRPALPVPVRRGHLRRGERGWRLVLPACAHSSAINATAGAVAARRPQAFIKFANCSDPPAPQTPTQCVRGLSSDVILAAQLQTQGDIGADFSELLSAFMPWCPVTEVRGRGGAGAGDEEPICTTPPPPLSNVCVRVARPTSCPSGPSTRSRAAACTTSPSWCVPPPPLAEPRGVCEGTVSPDTPSAGRRDQQRGHHVHLCG
jgi:hypothetical protein